MIMYERAALACCPPALILVAPFAPGGHGVVAVEEGHVTAGPATESDLGWG
ncbi:hypothetical protein [Streptomyces sp. NBC_01431]|uniref:hypothetical protein n=1 Tax=Streptomyces sp. NBC_01431 TaxID=2903863 RepID=UPI002E3056BE|nr:hypothetical protein [Streptomyces sp. NBC_01431]